MCRFALTSGGISFGMYYVSRSQKRRERMRRTAIRHSVLNSLQLRSLVTGNLSLREILSQFSLPHVTVDDDVCFTSTSMHLRSLDGRVDPTARVEAQGPTVIWHSSSSFDLQSFSKALSSVRVDGIVDSFNTSSGFPTTVDLNGHNMQVSSNEECNDFDERFLLPKRRPTTLAERLVTHLERQGSTYDTSAHDGRCLTPSACRQDVCVPSKPSLDKSNFVFNQLDSTLRLTKTSWLELLK